MAPRTRSDFRFPETIRDTVEGLTFSILQKSNCLIPFSARYALTLRFIGLTFSLGVLCPAQLLKKQSGVATTSEVEKAVWADDEKTLKIMANISQNLSPPSAPPKISRDQSEEL